MTLEETITQQFATVTRLMTQLLLDSGAAREEWERTGKATVYLSKCDQVRAAQTELRGLLAQWYAMYPNDSRFPAMLESAANTGRILDSLAAVVEKGPER